MPAFTPADFLREEHPPDDLLGAVTVLWISEPGRLTQFGAAIDVLAPGARSSLKHWHAEEDEFVYMLEGEVTLIEGEGNTILRPGDAATFKAGAEVGHCLVNESAAPARYLVVGTRAARDVVTYPDHGRILHRDRSATEDVWTDLEGRPARSPYRDPAKPIGSEPT